MQVMKLSRLGREIRTCSERGVEDPFLAKALQQASCASEHSAKTDIFSEDQCPMVIPSCCTRQQVTASAAHKSSTTLYLLLFSKAIARASLTAVQRLMRDVSGFSELEAAAVESPRKIKLQLCLLSALRPREHCGIISSRR